MMAYQESVKLANRASAEVRRVRSEARKTVKDPDGFAKVMREQPADLAGELLWDLVCMSRTERKKSVWVMHIAKMAHDLGYDLLQPLGRAPLEVREWLAVNGTVGMHRPRAARPARHAEAVRSLRAGSSIGEMRRVA
jgi:hypothetical protein